MRTLAALLLAAPFILAACTPAPQRQLIVNNSGMQLYATDSDQRMLFIKDIEANDTHRYCLTPQNDAIGGSSDNINLAGGAAGAKEGISFDKAKRELNLGGRSPAVLISRELMYRACELSSNLNADPETTLKIYERFLQAVEKVALSQTGTGTAAVSLDQSAQASDDDSDSDDGGVQVDQN